jgi:hypothetical protein
MSLISSLSPAAGATNAPAAGVTSALRSGADLIDSADAQLNQDAAEIADPSAPDLTGPLLDLNQSLFTAEAGAAVVRAADRTLGSILDVFA